MSKKSGAADTSVALLALFVIKHGKKIKYVLCLVTILLLAVDAFIYFDLKKYIKVHENELVENHIKGLLGRAVAMTVISVGLGVIAIILQIM